MNTILNRLHSLATNIWSGYKKLPPVLRIAGGIGALVMFSKICWPITLVAVLTATVVLLWEEPAAN